jgi:hypothetical protein
MKRKLTAMALAIGVIAALTGPTVAGHLASVTSYTGCLVSKDGVIIRIKAGDAPSSPCSGGMVEVHFSGGDITSISVTGALTGGGDNGAITIGLKPEFTLPTGCDSGEIAEWTGSAWTCGVDDDTTYSEGTGLDLTGTTFSIEPSYRVKNTPDCLTGQFATGFADAGTITCTAPPAALPEVWFFGSSGDAPMGHENEITSKFLLAGNYLVNIAGEARDDFDGNEKVSVYCQLYVGDDHVDTFSAEASEAENFATVTLATAYVAELTATTKLKVLCGSYTGSDHVQITVTILKVGTVHH